MESLWFIIGATIISCISKSTKGGAVIAQEEYKLHQSSTTNWEHIAFFIVTTKRIVEYRYILQLIQENKNM